VEVSREALLERVMDNIDRAVPDGLFAGGR
jgi:hypothetical protein